VGADVDASDGHDHCQGQERPADCRAAAEPQPGDGRESKRHGRVARGIAVPGREGAVHVHVLRSSCGRGRVTMDFATLARIDTDSPVDAEGDRQAEPSPEQRHDRDHDDGGAVAELASAPTQADTARRQVVDGVEHAALPAGKTIVGDQPGDHEHGEAANEEQQLCA